MAHSTEIQEHQSKSLGSFPLKERQKYYIIKPRISIISIDELIVDSGHSYLYYNNDIGHR